VIPLFGAVYLALTSLGGASRIRGALDRLRR